MKLHTFSTEHRTNFWFYFMKFIYLRDCKGFTDEKRHLIELLVY